MILLSFSSNQNIPLLAATITVGDGIDSNKCSEIALVNTINNAASGDTILLNCPADTNIILSQTLQIDKDLTIESINGPCVSLDGGSNKRIMNISGLGTRVKLTNLTFQNGKTNTTNNENPEADNAGGAILTGNEVDLTIENTLFNNNTAGVGGAVYSGFRGKLTVINSKFENNQALAAPLFAVTERSGGAIATKAGNTVVIKKSDFIGNKGGLGGALNILLSSLDVQDSVFKNNSTTGGVGGAIYTDGASELINDNVGGDIIIKNSRFEGNSGSDGGAIYPFMYQFDKALMENLSFINNTSSGSGGAIRAGNSDLTINNSSFVGNKAKNGGAVLLQNEGNVIFNNSLFANNEATEQGGALLAGLDAGFSVNLDNITMSNNRAGDYAGAIANQGMLEANIITKDSVYFGNTSGNPFNSAINVYAPITDNGNNFQFPDTYVNTNVQGYTNVTVPITITDPKLTSFVDTGVAVQNTVCVTDPTILAAGAGFVCDNGVSNILGSNNPCKLNTKNSNLITPKESKPKMKNVRTGGFDN